MSDQTPSRSTPVSLLRRLNERNEPDDWGRFVRLYSPVLSAWCRRLGLRREDAADLIQDVFVSLSRSLPSFRCDPGRRFRGWLWTVLIHQHRSNLRRRPPPSGVEAVDVEGADNVAEWVEEEYRRHLVARALELMRVEFPDHTWKACWEYIVRERPAAEVRAVLGITVNAVHLAKYRITRRLREELDGGLLE